MTKQLRQEIIFSCFVTDAATMPLHWIYDISYLRSLLMVDSNLIQKPEFFYQHCCKFYNSNPDDKKCGFAEHYSKGTNSPNGETGKLMLDYFIATNGKFISGENLVNFQYNWFKKYSGRKDSATKEFIKNYESAKEEKYPISGADDYQCYYYFKIPQIYLLFAKVLEEEYLNIVEQSIRSLQNNPRAIACGKTYALLLKKCAEGSSFSSALSFILSTPSFYLSKEKEYEKEIKDLIQFCLNNINKLSMKDYDKHLDFEENGFAGKLAKKLNFKEKDKADVLSCAAPSNFAFCIKIVLDTEKSFPEFGEEGMKFGIRRNIISGGDNVGRSWMISSLISSLGGKIPSLWKEKYSARKEIEELIQTVGKYS
eukprot:snap_masked-scaffold_59-processed-gene-0.67-mRNA-1 protein AED:1.00 eAED:1.00 QI:0/-1/0/0/-1/1/1/0/367